MYWKKYILFLLLMLLLHQIIFYVLEKLIMTIDGKIRGEKLQYNINRKATKILALSSWKIDKYEYLAGEEILPLDQRRMIECIFSNRKSYRKQTKAVEEHGKKHIKTIEEYGK